MKRIDSLCLPESGTGYHSILYGQELTEHEIYGRLVLVVSAFLVNVEDSDRKVGIAELRLVAPDYFSRWETLEEMFGFDGDEELSLLEIAGWISEYQACVTFQRHDIDSFDEVEPIVAAAVDDALFLDATIHDVLSDSKNLLALKMGEEPGSEFIDNPYPAPPDQDTV